MLLNETRAKHPFWQRRVSLYLTVVFILIGFWLGMQAAVKYPQNPLLVAKPAKEAAAPSGEEGKVEGLEELAKELPAYLGQDVDAKLFTQVWQAIQENYIDRPVTPIKLFYGALEGLTAAVGDPYTNFLTPENTEEFGAELAGRFEGIGAEIAIKNERLTVVAPLPGTPVEA